MMIKFRRVLIIIALLFAVGAFICSFFMQTSLNMFYNSYTRRYEYYYSTNPFGPPVISLLSVIIPAQIAILVFSFFDKSGFYRASIAIGIVKTILSILSVVFSGISIAYAAEEAPAIVATVFCGILIGVSLLSLILCAILLARTNQRSYYKRKPIWSSFQYKTHSSPNSASESPKEVGDIVKCRNSNGIGVYQNIDNTTVRLTITSSDELEILEINSLYNLAKLKRLRDGKIFENISLKDFCKTKKKEESTPKPIVEDKPLAQTQPAKEEKPVVAPKIEPTIDKPEVHSEKETIELLREYKKLLDEGVITQEEFDKKKKSLLN